jgi:hypothetical protein
MVMNEHNSDKYGKTRTGWIACQARDADEAVARSRAEAARKRIAEPREWDEHPPRRSREVADRAAEAAERERDITRAIEHPQAATRDRTAASDDQSRSQQATAASRRRSSAYDAG